MARILLLDDDDVVREDIGVTLRQWGYDVDLVGDLESAYLALSRNCPDLILCDINLPTGTGFDLLRDVVDPKFGLENTPVIIVTSSCDENSKLYGEWCGATEYLVKPIDYCILKRLIDQRLKIRSSWWQRMLMTSPSRTRSLVRREQFIPKPRTAFGTRR